MLSKTIQNKHTPKKRKTDGPMDFVDFFFFFCRGMMFIASMSSPLNLLHLANIIYCLVMDDAGVAETHLAKQDKWAYSIPVRFLRDSSHGLWMEMLPKREGKGCKPTWCCTVRQEEAVLKVAKTECQANGCVPRDLSGMHSGIYANNLVTSVCLYP